jgi:diguanylate cyclase (GGDEF)-like protein
MASALDARDIVQVLVQAVYNSIRCDVSAALLLHEDGGKPWALAVAKQHLTREEEQALLEGLSARLPEELRPDLSEVRLHVAVVEPLASGVKEPPAQPVDEEAPAPTEIPIWGKLEHGYLAAHDQIDGVIAYAQRVPLYWEDQELAMFGILVAQGSVALENSRLFARTHELAVRDGLTGLYNHRHFFQALADEIGRARLHGYPTAVVMVDLDGGQRGGLKAINDALGHLAGDELLREVGRAIAGIVRRGDLVARYGGDEYAVMAPRTNADQALALANRIAEELRRRVFDIQGVAASVTASIGAAVSDPGDEDASAVVSRADAGLYQAKARGGDQVCFVGVDQPEEAH